MQTAERWHEAQCAEREYWSGVTAGDAEVLRILAENQARAARLEALLPENPEVCLEIGVGGLGVGVVGFLRGVQSGVGIDPLPPVELKCAKPLRQYVETLRIRVANLVASGENIPLPDASVDLVVCCNVLDHVQSAGAVLAEARRILRPRGWLFLEVDTFSLAGLIKWHGLTKRLHANEILVRAHPYRFQERDVLRLLHLQGFVVTRRVGHSWLSGIAGASRRSVFLAVRK